MLHLITYYGYWYRRTSSYHTETIHTTIETYSVGCEELEMLEKAGIINKVSCCSSLDCTC